jgi:Mn-dependent DtxR family transcriptional regulator
MIYWIYAYVKKENSVMKIHESSEDYLEKILMLKQEHGNVHAIDIATFMDLSKPTVSIALKKLQAKGLINIDDQKNITLTEAGNKIASKTYEKHNFVAELLIRMGVSEKQAYEDSCHIEHCLSDESFSAIKKYVKKLDI